MRRQKDPGSAYQSLKSRDTNREPIESRTSDPDSESMTGVQEREWSRNNYPRLHVQTSRVQEHASGNKASKAQVQEQGPRNGSQETRIPRKRQVLEYGSKNTNPGPLV
jgi:hypothetical protein